MLADEARLCGGFQYYFSGVSNALVTANSALNFAIYFCFNQRFRAVLAFLLRGQRYPPNKLTAGGPGGSGGAGGPAGGRAPSLLLGGGGTDTKEATGETGGGGGDEEEFEGQARRERGGREDNSPRCVRQQPFVQLRRFRVQRTARH